MTEKEIFETQTDISNWTDLQILQEYIKHFGEYGTKSYVEIKRQGTTHIAQNAIAVGYFLDGFFISLDGFLVKSSAKFKLSENLIPIGDCAGPFQHDKLRKIIEPFKTQKKIQQEYINMDKELSKKSDEIPAKKIKI